MDDHGSRHGGAAIPFRCAAARRACAFGGRQSGQGVANELAAAGSTGRGALRDFRAPPYLFKKTARPTISKAPQEIHYGGAVAILSPQASNIKWASLIAPGLTTHSFNVNQRLVDVPFTVALPNTLNATITANSNVAPQVGTCCF